MCSGAVVCPDRSERARQELADLGARFLSADLGNVPELEPRADHASYLASWLEVFQALHLLSSRQRAVTYLHDLQPKPAEIDQAA